VKSNSTTRRAFHSEGRHVHQYSRFDHCALCDQKFGSSGLLVLLTYGATWAIAYRLCRSCKPTPNGAMSELQLKMIEMRLDIDAEKLGWLNPGRAS
jgi:hypothetical protein